MVNEEFRSGRYWVRVEGDPPAYVSVGDGESTVTRVPVELLADAVRRVREARENDVGPQI